MKNIILFFIGFSLITLSSCKDKEKQVSEETETSNIEEIAEKSSEDLIANGKVGGFKIGYPIPETSKKFGIEKSQQTRMTEGGPSEEIIYVVSENGRKQFILKPQFDPQKNGFNNRIGEIMVISEKYKTNEGIGVNSTIAEFQKTYPNFKIWHTYVSDKTDTYTIKLMMKLNLICFSF